MKTIKIGLVQMYCEKGAIDGNLASIEAYLREGVSRNVDIMCFPERLKTGVAHHLLMCEKNFTHIYPGE